MSATRGLFLNAFDIIFLSFDESNGDKNWLELKSRFPRAKRVHGVRGIGRAHREAARRSETPFFFIVDGDNRISEGFSFEAPEGSLCEKTLYVWRCHNPVNDLVYGYGAIKLYNKALLERPTQSFVDLATTLPTHYKVIHKVASSTHFYVTPFEAWRGAFRECAKLSSEIIRGQKSEETGKRLEQWSQTLPVLNHDWVRVGARQGQSWGEENYENLDQINDFEWLKKTYAEHVTK